MQLLWLLFHFADVYDLRVKTKLEIHVKLLSNKNEKSTNIYQAQARKQTAECFHIRQMFALGSLARFHLSVAALGSPEPVR